MIRISGGRVVDPANGVDRVTDLWLTDGKVTGIGEQPPAGWADTKDAETLDARGCVVCPGFIDLHMHEDPVGGDGHIRYGIFDCMLRMGVTTAVGGNCGSNAAHPAAYLDTVDREGAPVNVALLAGHGYFRYRAGARDKYAPATAEQRTAIRRMLREALDAGCAGISFGVRYQPGADGEELLTAASAAEGTGKLIAAHVRNDAAYIFDAIRETEALGRAFGLPVQISHIGSMGGFGQMRQVLADMEASRAAGLDVAMDCYPYEAFSTEIGSTTYDDGWLERYGCDYSVLEFCEGPWKGRRASKETFDAMRRDLPDSLTVCYVMRAGDVDMALRHPMVAVASDGILNDGQGHPRAAGTFPRFLSKYVREGGVPLSEGIRKMTALPAARLGVPARKGQLGIGADADVTVFDPAVVRDRADFDSPTTAPEGIRYVVVGGRVAVRDGRVTDARCGRSVRVGNREAN
ncbi:MAG: amidohydrolase family protein [Clostridia bacterium]|nr:amidohydrolase family protein [Clostridia bacterium]